MKVQTFTVNPFEMNCYVYYDDSAEGGSKEGIIIDPGAFTTLEKDLIENFISRMGIKIRLILNTHGHIDHILGNAWAKDLFGAPILMHRDDLPLLEMSKEQGRMFDIEFTAPPLPDKFISEEDIIKAGSGTLEIIHTPGHSPGGICFVDVKNKVIFGGDCIFMGSIGRTDLWEGSVEVLLDSINNKIFRYGDDFVIYPGHYEETTIRQEKESNPFLSGEAAI